jgi:hypothetical protein
MIDISTLPLLRESRASENMATASWSAMVFMAPRLSVCSFSTLSASGKLRLSLFLKSSNPLCVVFAVINNSPQTL